MTDVDRVLEDHARRAATAPLPADSWDRLAVRLDRGAGPAKLGDASRDLAQSSLDTEVSGLRGETDRRELVAPDDRSADGHRAVDGDAGRGQARTGRRSEARASNPWGTGIRRNGFPLVGRPDRRPLLLVAAAVLVVAGIVGAIAVVRHDGDDGRVRTNTPSSIAGEPDEPTPTTDPPGTASTGPDVDPATPTTPAGDRMPPDAAPRPTAPAPIGAVGPYAWVEPAGDGIGLGSVLLRQAVGGQPLVAWRVPTQDPDVEGGAYGALDVELGPDGTLYYERCCEPAVGEIYAYDPQTGSNERVAYGEHPAISPDGGTLALSDQANGVRLLDLATGAARVLRPVPEGGSDVSTSLVGALAWSPDGTTLAIEIADYDVGPAANTLSQVSVELWDVAAGTHRRLAVQGFLDGSWGQPAFRADGRLLVATGYRIPEGTDRAVAGKVQVVDPVTGEVVDDLEVDGLVGLDASPDGGRVVATLVDGTAFLVVDGDRFGRLDALDVPPGAIAVTL